MRTRLLAVNGARDEVVHVLRKGRGLVGSEVHGVHPHGLAGGARGRGPAAGAPQGLQAGRGCK